MARVRISHRYCKGCGLCVMYCNRGVLAMPEETGPKGVQVPAVIEGMECRACMRCVLMCPDAAIEIESDEAVCPEKDA